MSLGYNQQSNQLMWGIGIVSGAWLVQWLGGIPWLWLAPVMGLFIMDRPLFYLSGLVIIGELMTSMAPGMVTVIVLAPWIIWRIWKPQIDLSIVFWLWITGLIGGQAVIYFGPEIIAVIRLLPEYQQVAYYLARGIPWAKTAGSLLLAISLSYVVVVITYFNRRSANMTR